MRFMKQYLVLPAGDIKIKQTDWIVLTNASPLNIEHFNDIPIKREGNAFIYLRDVATVQLMGRVQQNAVLVKGKQTVILVAMKSTEASTLDVVDGIKKMIPRAEQISPEGVQIKLLDDASTFVKDSISDVLHEMLLAGALVGLIVLLLLGSWRATVIVWTSIPLSIMTAIIGLHWLDETINVMMQVRSQRIPQIGLGGKVTDSRHHIDTLARDPDIPITGPGGAVGGIASWEPDFWSAIRNATRVETYRAEERASDWGLARLSLQAEIASNYVTLRGLDAQAAIYKQSIDLYRDSLDLIRAQFAGAIASGLDVARAESILYGTETKYAQIQGQRQVTEQAIAILVNVVPASFKIEPVGDLRVAKFTIPRSIPSTLLERRPDIAAMERRMAEANRAIGIARAAFFPDVKFSADGGFINAGFDVAKLVGAFWSYGSVVSLPVFQGGYRRAELQRSWSTYRETEDRYRSTVLNAFREVENGLSLTNRLTVAANRQDAAVGATLKVQDLTMLQERSTTFERQEGN